MQKKISDFRSDKNKVFCMYVNDCSLENFRRLQCVQVKYINVQYRIVAFNVACNSIRKEEGVGERERENAPLI